jgi:adenylosuccinate synthase
MKGLERLLNDVKVMAVVCNQFGDTGKGKFSDYFAANWADVIARGTGGNNAGHTVVVNGQERIFHLIPAGIAHEGKTNILGNGMVIDLEVLCHELDELDNERVNCGKLMISKDAHVIMPYHVDFDTANNKSMKDGGIGSTGRGIGPAYTDKIARRGIRVGDLYEKDIMAKKLRKIAEFYREQKIDSEEIMARLGPFAERLFPFVKDSVSEMHNFISQGKRVLLEGAQGLLLSIEHGTYPYVTSSDCSLNGTASGVGISASAVDLSLGIVKFPFMTRVGGGPFPTELGRKVSEEYCAESGHEKQNELKMYMIPHSIENGRVKYNPRDEKIMEMINSDDDFMKGVGIRLAAGEYGATTGRPRRIGWTDAVAAKYAAEINRSVLVLTKVDCLAGARKFDICYGYNEKTTQFNRDEEFLRSIINPVKTTYEGYGDISDVRDYDKLPRSLAAGIEDFEKFVGKKVAIVSVGAEREATIVR